MVVTRGLAMVFRAGGKAAARSRETDAPAKKAVFRLRELGKVSGAAIITESSTGTAMPRLCSKKSIGDTSQAT